MYTSFAEIGLYSAAFKLIAVMNLFTTGFSTFWYPFAYEQYEKNPENREIFSKVFEYVSFLMLALGLIILSGKNLIFMLFAKSYRSSAYIAPFLLLYPVSIMMAIVVARGIDFAKKTYWFMVSDGVAALFNLFGNLLLIPSLGAKGAALSTGLSFVIVFAIESSVSVRLYPVKYSFKKVYTSIGIFTIVAALNSFIERPSVGVLSGLMGLTLVILLYQDVFKRLVRDVFEVWDLVAKKYR
jgi:O-antigen/teichoic acid export membrane protein